MASSTKNLWEVSVGSMLKPAAADPKGTHYFRATFELPEGTDTAKLNDARKAYLEKLLADKKLRAAGVYVNNPLAGLEILSVNSREEAEAIMKDDPFVKELNAKTQIIEWDPKFGDFK